MINHKSFKHIAVSSFTIAVTLLAVSAVADPSSIKASSDWHPSRTVAEEEADRRFEAKAQARIDQIKQYGGPMMYSMIEAVSCERSGKDNRIRCRADGSLSTEPND